MNNQVISAADKAYEEFAAWPRHLGIPVDRASFCAGYETHALRAEQMEKSHSLLVEALKKAQAETNHGIPFYAYGDNQAGCEFAHRLTTIGNLVSEALKAAGEL